MEVRIPVTRSGDLEAIAHALRADHFAGDPPDVRGIVLKINLVGDDGAVLQSMEYPRPDDTTYVDSRRPFGAFRVLQKARRLVRAQDNIPLEEALFGIAPPQDHEWYKQLYQEGIDRVIAQEGETSAGPLARYERVLDAMEDELDAIESSLP